MQAIATVDDPMCLALAPAEDIVILSTDTAWRVPLELLILSGHTTVHAGLVSGGREALDHPWSPSDAKPNDYGAPSRRVLRVDWTRFRQSHPPSPGGLSGGRATLTTSTAVNNGG